MGAAHSHSAAAHVNENSRVSRPHEAEATATHPSVRRLTGSKHTFTFSRVGISVFGLQSRVDKVQLHSCNKEGGGGSNVPSYFSFKRSPSLFLFPQQIAVRSRLSLER